jgi:hypothetical protein
MSLEGLDPSWVTITPTNMRLKVNQRASVTVSITPPRAPSSRAGPHHLAVTVTSPNYPGRMSRRGATLVINPFYEFAMSELSPHQLTACWIVKRWLDRQKARLVTRTRWGTWQCRSSV